MRGVPLFGTLLGGRGATASSRSASCSAPALRRALVRAGAAAAPGRSARSGRGRGSGGAIARLARRRPRRRPARSTARPATSTPSGAAPGFAGLIARVWRDRGFGDFWGYALVAEGAAEAMVEVGLNELGPGRAAGPHRGGRWPGHRLRRPALHPRAHHDGLERPPARRPAGGACRRGTMRDRPWVAALGLARPHGAGDRPPTMFLVVPYPTTRPAIRHVLDLVRTKRARPARFGPGRYETGTATPRHAGYDTGGKVAIGRQPRLAAAAPPNAPNRPAAHVSPLTRPSGRP